MNKILVYTHQYSPRIKYIFDFLLHEFLGLTTEYITNKADFKESHLPKISYCQEKISDELHITSSEFLYHNSISNDVLLDDLNDVEKCFYALSCYEEYLPGNRDLHNRFMGKDKNILEPFVDVFSLKLKENLSEKYPQLHFKKREFQLIATYDVDHVWQYKHKEFIKTLGGFFKDAIRLNFRQILSRFQVVFLNKKDPFDTFDYLKSLQDKHNFKTIFFWLMADYGGVDKNNPINSTAFTSKIKNINQWATVEIHPSYASHSNYQLLKKEINLLKKALNKPITKSRQHYINLTLPKTYRNLIAASIKEDYTMGYADQIGFRAGTCTPFFWYDLEYEKITNLKIFPFCAMDVTLQQYLKLTPKQAQQKLLALKNQIKQVNGTMITLFHNSSLHNQNEWKGWQSIYESIVKDD